VIDEALKYDENNSLLSYSFEDREHQIKIDDLENAAVNWEKKIILMTTNKDDTENLVGYSLKGQFLFSNPAPEHYKFWYLSPSDLRVACEGKDEFAEKSGRTGWWFKINQENGEMTKDCWAY
jgi:hypothetical protein